MGKNNSLNCKVCGTANAPSAAKCKRCGFALSEPEAAAQPAGARPEADEQVREGQIEAPYTRKEADLLDSLNHAHLPGFFARLLLKPFLHKINPRFRALAIKAAILLAVFLTFSSKYFEKDAVKKNESEECFASRVVYANALGEEAASLVNNRANRLDANAITSRITTFYCNSVECEEARGMKLDDSCGNTNINYEPGDSAGEYRILIDSDKARTCKICITPRGVYPNTFGECAAISGAKCP